ncbi:hydrogenase maturation protease [Dethiothermospora halolimnae]|uniref:hydrogenase maturation protease n=1 Tax=Dethiothermospora halolimnae TaxID=3114390 RepID=UPI003CCC0FAF
MIKVIGIGNRLMGDDAIGLKVLEKIQYDIKEIDEKIDIIFGETDFLYCLDNISNNDIVIILDSTYLGLDAGNITLFTFEEYIKYIDKPKGQHDINLIDMIIKNNKNIVGYIIGIEVFDISFNLDISYHLETKFDYICDNVLNKIKLILKMIELGEYNA